MLSSWEWKLEKGWAEVWVVTQSWQAQVGVEHSKKNRPWQATPDISWKLKGYSLASETHQGWSGPENTWAPASNQLMAWFNGRALLSSNSL